MIALTLLTITLITSLAAWFAQPTWQINGMMYPYQVKHQRKYFQIISHGFLHADFTHLAFNMITFFFFGPLMEQVLGSFPFLILYISGLLVSSIPTLLRHSDNPNYATLGASGAVESVLFAFILLFPAEKIYIFLIPIGIPAILFGFIYMGYSIYSAKQQQGNINHDAHIAGAVWGVLYTIFFVPDALLRFSEQLKSLF